MIEAADRSHISATLRVYLRYSRVALRCAWARPRQVRRRPSRQSKRLDKVRQGGQTAKPLYRCRSGALHDLRGPILLHRRRGRRAHGRRRLRRRGSRRLVGRLLRRRHKRHAKVPAPAASPCSVRSAPPNKHTTQPPSVRASASEMVLASQVVVVWVAWAVAKQRKVGS